MTPTPRDPDTIIAMTGDVVAEIAVSLDVDDYLDS